MEGTQGMPVLSPEDFATYSHVIQMLQQHNINPQLGGSQQTQGLADAPPPEVTLVANSKPQSNLSPPTGGFHPVSINSILYPVCLTSSCTCGPGTLVIIS